MILTLISFGVSAPQVVVAAYSGYKHRDLVRQDGSVKPYHLVLTVRCCPPVNPDVSTGLYSLSLCTSAISRDFFVAGALKVFVTPNPLPTQPLFVSTNRATGHHQHVELRRGTTHLIASPILASEMK